MVTPTRPIWLPRWGGPFARDASQSAFPELWHLKEAHVVPALGMTHKFLWDLARRDPHNCDVSNALGNTWVWTEWGTQLDWDGSGTDKFVDFDFHGRPVDVTVKPLSIAMRVMLAAKGPQSTFSDLIGNENDGSGETHILIRYRASTDVVQFLLGTDGVGEDRIDGPTFNLNQWYHIVGTYDGANIRLYVDGLEVANSPVASTRTVNSTAKLFVGRGVTNSDRVIQGHIDDVRIYHRLLSEREAYILAAYPWADLMLRDSDVGKAAAAAASIAVLRRRYEGY